MASRQDWLRTAVHVLGRDGVEGVRVDPLARALGVTKGSFYWHFRSRGDLLDALIDLWEEETTWLVAQASTADSPRNRLLRFFQLISPARNYPSDREMFAWARRSAILRTRANAVELKRVSFIEQQLIAASISAPVAARRAEIAYLATLGWLERRGRSEAMDDSLGEFAEHLFPLMLAGSKRSRSSGRAKVKP
ncbi:MAG: TetR/AcrR family transcriptional regulator [Gemmatimonadaceae bacterium]